MSEKDLSLRAHLFVCTNQKANGSCCGAKGGAELRAAVKELSKARPEWKGKVRINSAGCLGHCEEGIAAVIYPQGKWFTNLKSSDSQLLIDAVDEALKSK
jgi:(2Fe-2S) ferredoxin